MKNPIRIILATGMLALFSISVLTGLLVWLVFPHGPGNNGLTWLISDIHKWVSLIFVILVLTHVLIRWEWLKRNLKNM
ncbi:MAG TPA: DUF4405 domain-containing protein [Desulfotomaculum sp.]|nr:MAG: hypothetical protein VR67_02700 [Peptococcaceae bacterium BRH_c8a]KJS70219.1 MAG: hypothetical protein JL56_17380 [Desulfotomaculum sp. BICA1-6]HBX24579.1 DUF4405 domain-containing protein [Desulfotomaculum sp.]